ncbi:MAG TPA: ABC transporter substrate-binding protein [Pyrinomonadaceae bacterium]|jgi:peptide/nickel transport system substrate-binding protein|nr:ABC transporter substrate-binding protein [Pyrinomonadaceae bacterium]
MLARQLNALVLVLLTAILLVTNCRPRSDEFVIVLSDNISTLDPIGASTVDAASERVRVLIFNSLVRKNERFEYVPELASSIEPSADGLSYTFTLRDGVTFHDGRQMTSADAKYTLDTLLASGSGKAASFFEATPSGGKQPYVTGVEAPDARNLIIRLRKPWLSLLSNLVPIAIIPKDSAATQKDRPVGSGPFKFVRFDTAQQVVDLEAYPNYWEGAPQIRALRVRVIADANALQAELRTGRVQVAPLPTNLTPDALKSLGQDQNLKVEQFPGANIVHLTFNTESAPLDKVAVRQAISFAIDRESLIRDLLLGQAKIAHSILPEESWAYAPGQKYNYDPERARKLLDEAGFRDPDGDGPQMRFPKPIVLKISSSSGAARQYSGVIQNQLKQVGIKLEIETVESNTLRDQQLKGNYQLTTGSWVGGNQDPIFLKDLFSSTGIPKPDRVGFNRSRYNNPELDPILQEAVDTADREKARVLYTRAQEIISRDVPMLPLWYPANMVVARKNVGNIKIDGSGDWRFVRGLTIEK